jgi:hypothetical protein
MRLNVTFIYTLPVLSLLSFIEDDLSNSECMMQTTEWLLSRELEAIYVYKETILAYLLLLFRIGLSYEGKYTSGHRYNPEVWNQDFLNVE